MNNMFFIACAVGSIIAGLFAFLCLLASDIYGKENDTKEMKKQLSNVVQFIIIAVVLGVISYLNYLKVV